MPLSQEPFKNHNSVTSYSCLLCSIGLNTSNTTFYTPAVKWVHCALPSPLFVPHEVEHTHIYTHTYPCSTSDRRQDTGCHFYIGSNGQRKRRRSKLVPKAQESCPRLDGVLTVSALLALLLRDPKRQLASSSTSESLKSQARVLRARSDIGMFWPSPT